MSFSHFHIFSGAGYQKKVLSHEPVVENADRGYFVKSGCCSVQFYKRKSSTRSYRHANSFSLSAGHEELEIASHVLQFTYNACEGNFQYPFCYYPTTKLNGASLADVYWEGIAALRNNGFHAYMGICDGGQANRTLILLHFESESDAINKQFTVENPYTGEPHVFMMDPSVCISLEQVIFD